MLTICNRLESCYQWNNCGLIFKMNDFPYVICNVKNETVIIKYFILSMLKHLHVAIKKKSIHTSMLLYTSYMVTRVGFSYLHSTQQRSCQSQFLTRPASNEHTVTTWPHYGVRFPAKYKIWLKTPKNSSSILNKENTTHILS